MLLRNHHAGCCGFNPTHPAGGQWSHVLALHDGSTVYADTAAEVVEELIEGYPTLDAGARLSARVRLAEEMAALAQDLRIDQAVARGVLDPADPEQAALVEILRADKSASLLLELDDAPGDQAPWLPLPELVLVTSSYAPHTSYPAVEGNVVWVDPSDDAALLASFRTVGVFDYWAAASG